MQIASYILVFIIYSEQNNINKNKISIPKYLIHISFYDPSTPQITEPSNNSTKIPFESKIQTLTFEGYRIHQYVSVILFYSYSSKFQISNFKIPNFLKTVLKLFSVCFNHFLIPIKGIFFHSFLGSFSKVILINIDKTISFTHFSSSRTDNVNRSPAQVS